MYRDVLGESTTEAVRTTASSPLTAFMWTRVAMLEEIPSLSVSITQMAVGMIGLDATQPRRLRLWATTIFCGCTLQLRLRTTSQVLSTMVA